MPRPLALLALLLLTPAAAAAQSAAPRPPVRVWLVGGVGAGRAGAGPYTETGGHLSGRLAATVRRGGPFATLRVTNTSGGASAFTGPLLSVGPRRDGFFDAGVLVGYAVPVAGTVEVSAAAGVARAWGSRAYPNDCRDFCLSTGRSEPFGARVGVPLEVGVSVGLSRGARLGVVGYADVNGEGTFGGVLGTVSARLPALTF